MAHRAVAVKRSRLRPTLVHQALLAREVAVRAILVILQLVSRDTRWLHLCDLLERVPKLMVDRIDEVLLVVRRVRIHDAVCVGGAEKRLAMTHDESSDTYPGLGGGDRNARWDLDSNRLGITASGVEIHVRCRQVSAAAIAPGSGGGRSPGGRSWRYRRRCPVLRLPSSLLEERAAGQGRQVSLRPRERFWDIPVPKIDSAFDSLFVPRPSRSLALRDNLA
ncbi:MAG: hypothetical protein JMN24_18540, partial [gamma proteobacterium endosymbiont of Lamellibrachia anaximandri]|nr:hypothetical protein [gamma proteobacterium endosymbiont of Lamellibrachia anaximandri]